jgi:hypothetical protein
MDDEDGPASATGDGVHRRRFLQTAVAGGVAAWSIPLVSSLASGAPATSAICNCGGDENCVVGNCGPTDSLCSCAATVDGSCACFDPACSNPGTPCTTNAECGPGYACVLECCGNANSGICAQLCTGTRAPQAVPGSPPWGAWTA